MAIPRTNNDPNKGTLELEKVAPFVFDVFYAPTDKVITVFESQYTKRKNYRVKLLRIDSEHSTLTIYPINTREWSSKFLEQKYDRIIAITIDIDYLSITDDVDLSQVSDLLEEVPSGFLKDYNYGLGLAQDYRFIIYTLEELSSCTELVISKEVTTGPTKTEQFNLALQDYDEMRRSIDRNTARARRAAIAVKTTYTYNFVADKLDIKPRKIKLSPHPVTQLLTYECSGQAVLDETTQEALLKSVSENKDKIAREQPDKLAKLSSDIELVTLEVLIERFEEMLEQKLNENKWQEFFNENPFILSMAFGYPIIKVGDQASIGGRKLCGSGEKITDFLVKNSLTNNTALFEIKTPQTGLLESKPYRGGVYTPSKDLSGSINQALDQKYQLQRSFTTVKDTSRTYDIESYAVHSCLIIGRMPDGEDQQKSFELFRRNSKDVQIVTFDELHEKLKELFNFLSKAGNIDIQDK